MFRRTAPVLLALSALLVLVAVARPPGVDAADCAKDEVKIGIVEAKGCFSQRTPANGSPVFETTTKFRMNGFDVEPRAGTTVTFTPADAKRGASVSTGNGFVDLTATHPTFGTVRFNLMNFAFSPPSSGEMVLAESALAQPYPTFSGMLPAGVKQPIRLTAEGAEFDLNFTLGGLLGQLMTGSEKSIGFGVGFTVQDGAYRLTKGTFQLDKFELAKLLAVDSAKVEIGTDKVSVDFDAALKAVSSKGIIGGITVEHGAVTSFTLGISGLNQQLGTSGVFLQKLAATAFIAPPFGGSGTIGISAGPSVRFFGRDVTTLAADGTVAIRAEDIANHKPGFFSVNGDFTVVTLPVASARFAYYFGQGTDFGASIGIGLPSGTNDPGQPTYVGGSFNGWTTARHFDLQGTATLKLIGISMAGAKTVLSDIGIAGCVQLGLWVGGGIRWSDGRGEVLGGFSCDLGGYVPMQQSAVQRAQRKGGATISLDDEQVVRVLAADGAEAPQLALEEIDGDRALTTPDPDDEDGVVRTDDGVAVSGEDGMSGFVIPGDASGRWRLTAQPGSSAIATIETASRLPDHEVRARITGHGRDRILRWRAHDIPYQELEFSEVLPNGREVLIRHTHKHRGSVRFRPVEGPGTWNRKRKLAVDVVQRFGTPRDELVADTYRVRRRPAPRRVTHLQVERRLSHVVVSWHRATGAASHEVTAKAIGSGITYRETVGRRAHRVRLEDLGSSKRMRISVVPVNGQGRRGRAAMETIDTDDLVPNRRVAARELVARAQLRGRSVTTHPECPEPAECEVTLLVLHDGHVLGKAHRSLPPDMTDRLRARIPAGFGPRELTLVGRVSQLGATAAARGGLR